MDISNMDISDDEEEKENRFLSRRSKQNYSQNTLSLFQSQSGSDFQWLSDSDDDKVKEEIIFPSQKKNEKYSPNTLSPFQSLPNLDSDSKEESIQFAILYSMRTLEQEQKDKKQKSPLHPCTLTPLHSLSSATTAEVGSTSFPVTCPLCLDFPTAPIRIDPCSHLVCCACLVAHAADSLNQDIHDVGCPGPDCDVVLVSQSVRHLVPDDVWDRLCLARAEGSALASTTRITCPMEGCGREMMDDNREFLIRACTWCWRIFCTCCKAGWHLGMTCEEYARREKVVAARRRLIVVQREAEKNKRRTSKELEEEEKESDDEELQMVTIRPSSEGNMMRHKCRSRVSRNLRPVRKFATRFLLSTRRTKRKKP